LLKGVDLTWCKLITYSSIVALKAALPEVEVSQ
jgi:hypothetical protein